MFEVVGDLKQNLPCSIGFHHLCDVEDLLSALNHARLLRELRLLERRVHRSGRDSVDHGVGGSDDYSNSVCGALVLAAAAKSGLPKPTAAQLDRMAHPRRPGLPVLRPDAASPAASNTWTGLAARMRNRHPVNS